MKREEERDVYAYEFYIMTENYAFFGYTFFGRIC